MPHLDGPLFYPTISTISIGSHAVLNYFGPAIEDGDDSLATIPQNPALRILVQPRSLFISKHDMYHKYYHSIEEKEEDDLNDPLLRNVDDSVIAQSNNGVLKRTTRYSLTIRHVPKTTKLKLRF
jgi:alkylated DNA repair protein alkB family protein 6